MVVIIAEYTLRVKLLSVGAVMNCRFRAANFQPRLTADGTLPAAVILHLWSAIVALLSFGLSSPNPNSRIGVLSDNPVLGKTTHFQCATETRFPNAECTNRLLFLSLCDL